ncbi:MAG: pyridoxal phosphate-dependent aminotransferase [Oligoflexia bacterium]|nr:pyridoxal phosphate-dependent aminotransferase [Oligoflexia bacterium]MBF0366529.1 pyridoxal phosphate-dependent aminotransferase [Oligoflexia bacterium]
MSKKAKQTTPMPASIVSNMIKDSGLKSVGNASIREIKRLIDNIERASEKKFIRMEMGIPGIKPPTIGINAEIDAIRSGVTGIYPDIDGIPTVKDEISRFCKLFLDLEISPRYCVPTVGSMHGGYCSFLVSGRRYPEKDTILFLDPGFPVHKQMVKMQGLKQQSLDVYDYRGSKLRNKLESILKSNTIGALLYSNPNNPAWICFTDEELKIIGELATKYDVVVLEDLAYMAMDFRKDLSKPGVAPFQVSVSKYTDNYILLISSSKAFSYAGQRIGMMAISERLYATDFPGLSNYFPTNNFGHSMIYGALYATTSGTAHSAQYALAAILKAVNEEQYNFVEAVREYGDKANIIKKHFTNNGFHIVYDMDGDSPIADGFYFTVSYPGFSGIQLVEEFLYYGISAISLSTTGSLRSEGVRACVSLIPREMIPELKNRLEVFHQDHPLS